VNNTPRQINIFKALGKEPPVYAHLPTVLNEQGEKLSKRNGAKAVTEYAAEGYLPDAMVNYLARLGWSHGDDEIFSREQFIEWFNLDHLGKSAAQFDETKLRWVNAQHLKAMADDKLAEAVAPFLAAQGVTGLDAAHVVRGCGLFKDRCSTLVELAGWLKLLVTGGEPSAQDIATHVTDAVRPALAKLAEALSGAEWSKAAISAAIKQVLADTGLKMPQLAMPVRVLVMGTPQTPSLDAILELMKREDVVARLRLV
jgi:glutamyl-tRNA synthetase